jgi:hypothetical protein
MSRRRIRNILLKEWTLLFTDVNSAFVIALVPFLIDSLYLAGLQVRR